MLIPDHFADLVQQSWRIHARQRLGLPASSLNPTRRPLTLTASRKYLEWRCRRRSIYKLEAWITVVPVNDRDVEAWAARIRAHFEPRFQDIAESVALVFVDAVGPRIKDLRPGTRMGQVLSWLEDEKRSGASSLDWVEILVATQDEASSEATDAFAETLEQRTFREYVEHLYANQRGA
jgi:hypothetical protein